MILVIDNYDSLTWNLVHYLMELGAEVVILFLGAELTQVYTRRRGAWVAPAEHATETHE